MLCPSRSISAWVKALPYRITLTEPSFPLRPCSLPIVMTDPTRAWDFNSASIALSLLPAGRRRTFLPSSPVQDLLVCRNLDRRRESKSIGHCDPLNTLFERLVDSHVQRGESSPEPNTPLQLHKNPPSPYWRSPWLGWSTKPSVCVSPSHRISILFV